MGKRRGSYGANPPINHMFFMLVGLTHVARQKPSQPSKAVSQVITTAAKTMKSGIDSGRADAKEAETRWDFRLGFAYWRSGVSMGFLFELSLQVLGGSLADRLRYMGR